MDILSRVNWVDLLAVIIVLRITYIAFQDGLTHEIFPLVGTTATLVIALYYYKKLAIFVAHGVIQLPLVVLDFLSFMALTIAIGLAFKVVRRILDSIIKVSWHPAIEKFGGVLCGIVRASVVTSFILIILALLPISYLQWSIRDKSLTGMHFLRIGPTVYTKVSRFLPSLGMETLAGEALVKDIVSDKRIELFSSKNPKSKEADLGIE